MNVLNFLYRRSVLGLVTVAVSQRSDKSCKTSTSSRMILEKQRNPMSISDSSLIAVVESY